jgi:hypothetical protein
MRILHTAMSAFLALGATGAGAQAPAATGGRMVALTTVDRVSGEQAETRSAVLCVPERYLCLRAWRESDGRAWTLDIYDRIPAGARVAPVRRIVLPPGDNPDRETFRIWPHLIRETSGAVLIGLERHRTAGFSGGGAGQTEVVLFRLEPNAEPAEVLTVQTGYSSMIRACFSEAEYRRWGDACHDEYELTGRLSIASAAAPGRPRLALRTAARSFPRGARAEHSDRSGLRRSDLVWEPDPVCTYRRTFTFNAASGRYEPDRPLPDCSLYSLP